MSDYPVTRGARPDDPHLRLRLAALTAVITGVILVALAAFLFSYTGIHHIALQAGVAPRLARLYPLMFDAMLIITCSAVLATRTAGWGTKTYVWVCLLLVVGAVAVGDALYATGVHLTGQAARATIAVIPWVLLLLGFGIWLVMLRHWRRIRVAGAVNEAEAARPAQADQNGHAGRPVPAAPAGQPDRTPQAAQPAQPDRAAQAMAASAAAGGAVSWAAGRGAAAARSRTPRVGIDTLLEQQAGRAPERPPAADSRAASQATATGQDKQRTTAPGERQPAGTTAAAMAGTTAAAAAGTAAGIAAGTAAGTRGDTKPGTAGETRPETTAPATPAPAAAAKPGAAAATATTAAGTAAATRPGTAGTVPGATAATTPGTAGTTPRTAATPGTATTPGTAATPGTATTPGTAATPGTATTPGTAATTPGAAAATPGTSGAGAGADAKAGAAAADAAEPGRDGGGKDEGPAQNRRRRLGGLLQMPADADDEAGSVRILPAEPKAAPGDAAPGKDDEAGEAGTPAGAAAAAAEPDPANPPAPLPHFDRPRSTPTPPRETGTDGE
jgi:hypothetical protein